MIGPLWITQRGAVPDGTGTIVKTKNIQQLLGSLEAMPEDLRERVQAMAARKAPVDDSPTGKK